MDFLSKSIGLVLSGGGSKGIAQAGALKFLEEQNIKPTHIAGTSAGSIIAALYAFGIKPNEILEFFKSIYFFHWSHFTFKKAGIIDSQSFKADFEKIFKDAKIGDLNIPTYITATDLVKGRLKIFNNDTKITDAIIASSSYPGMLSPYELNGNLYSDGGILNHFPTDLIQGKCDVIIGIYVSPIQTIEAKDLNSIKSVTSRAFNLLSAQGNYQKFSLCDWVIEPKELANFSTFETNKAKMDEIFEIGYQAAKKSFEEMNS
ncbi:patatin-like phospholipase family protein [uncultured Flavobacterium sp.]|uniref:patatin-like phospholipase family protein n=1 Tax=uncultured Flavobacterium sp. TaxID=165435 RepID=UPI0030CA25F5